MTLKSNLFSRKEVSFIVKSIQKIILAVLVIGIMCAGAALAVSVSSSKDKVEPEPITDAIYPPVQDATSAPTKAEASDLAIKILPKETKTMYTYEEHELDVAMEATDSDAERKMVDTAKPAEEENETKSLTYLGSYYVVGYDTCVQCCGWSGGITASGAEATVGRTVASNDFPFGTELYIEGIGYRTVEDRGGMSSGVLDVLCNNHPECYAITGTYKVYLVS